MQGARPGRHGACEIRGGMGLEMPLATMHALARRGSPAQGPGGAVLAGLSP